MLEWLNTVSKNIIVFLPIQLNTSLNIIIGAGFSQPAGLPVGTAIQERFDGSLREKFYELSSSEWGWTDGRDISRRTGVEYQFILEEIVNEYKIAKNGFIDYEDFYQYVIDNIGVKGWYETISRSAKPRYYSAFNLREEDDNYGYAFRNPQSQRPKEIINHLIADLLSVLKNGNELKQIYGPFIRFLQKYKSVNIFSLNHDLLLEKLFTLFNLKFCDGFSSNDSCLTYKEGLLPIFISAFSSEPINLVKLHGSIDMYLFEHCNESGSMLTRTGEISYFKPGGHYEKHYTQRIDPKSRNVVQHFNPNIVPQFITGNNKREIIKSDYMYSEMYNLYKREISSNADLLIIGYSYRDKHINEELEKFSSTQGPQVINLNKRETFPFKTPRITEINSFSLLV